MEDNELEAMERHYEELENKQEQLERDAAELQEQLAAADEELSYDVGDDLSKPSLERDYGETIWPPEADGTPQTREDLKVAGL